MARSLSFFNNKGGVGKTTLLCNIAAYIAIEKEIRVLVIDADPQCNATQYMFSDEELNYFYEETSSFTIYNIVRPLSLGKGYSKELSIYKSKRFEVDVLPGDPRLALTEDLLAKDWSSASAGEARGMRTTLLFAELMKRCDDYDLVLFDVGPSLGSINRAVLLASDYFIAPMSIDIFSVKAIQNISTWLARWRKQWAAGIDILEEDDEVDLELQRNLEFIGYVSQQYIAKRNAQGSKRAVNAYDKIMSQFEDVIQQKLLPATPGKNKKKKFNLGSIPNLHSLIPMSQSSRSPVFALRGGDGVRGAHFSKVKDAHTTFAAVGDSILARTGLSDD